MSTKNKNSNRPVWIAIALVIGLGFTVWGIRWYLQPPVVSEGQLRYIQLLRTAVSSENEEHVAGVERVLKKKLDGGELTQKEWRHFQGIIDVAKRGEWESASRACEGFERAQQYR
jgi:hypothetical protein